MWKWTKTCLRLSIAVAAVGCAAPPASDAHPAQGDEGAATLGAVETASTCTPTDGASAVPQPDAAAPDADPDAETTAPGIDASGPDATPPGGSTPRWSEIFAKYLGPGTQGSCVDCHGTMASAEVGYEWLSIMGQIDGTFSQLGMRDGSILTWFGGVMPPGGDASYPEAEADIGAWVAAGAPND